MFARVSAKTRLAKQEIIIFMTNKLNKFITLFPPHFYSFLFTVSKRKTLSRADCYFFFLFVAGLMNGNCFKSIILTFHLAIFCGSCLTSLFKFAA